MTTWTNEGIVPSPPNPPPSGFTILPIAISHYASQSQLEKADAVVDEIATILARWGGDLDRWDVPGPYRTSDAVYSRLQAWSEPPRSRSSLLLWIGHGFSNDQNEAALFVPTGAVDTTMGPEHLATAVHDECAHRDEPHWAIVVIEACGGARFAELVAAQLLVSRARDGVLVIGIGAHGGAGYLGTFRDALRTVCDAYWSNDRIITLHDLGSRLDEILEDGAVIPGAYQGRAAIVPHHDLTPTLTTPVDLYPDLRAIVGSLPAAELERLAAGGMGADLLEFGGSFTGRVAERAEVVSWLDGHQHGLFVLVGSAGSGKSAFLANLVLNTIPGMARVLTESAHVGSAWPEAHRLPRVTGAVLLTGAATSDVLSRIAALAGLERLAGALPQDRIADLLRQLANRNVALTLIMDALDEAQDPVDIAGLVSQIAALPQVRVVLATRAAVGLDGPDLLGFLRRSTPGLLVVPLNTDVPAVLEFATERLGAVARPEELADVLEDVEHRLTASDRGATMDFLGIRLVVRELLAVPELMRTTAREARRAVVALDHAALFRMAYVRITAEFPPAGPLLRALAHARGRGLPRADRIWIIVAGVLDRVHVFTDADVERVLSVAGPYIMLDAEDGRSVFRLAHRSFVDELLDDGPGGREALDMLLALGEHARDARKDLSDPAPYVCRHLSGHAAAAGRAGWAILGSMPDVVDLLDLGALLADSWRATPGELPAVVTAVRNTAHLAATGTAEDRCGYRQLGAARATGSRPEPEAEPDDGGAAWRVRSARLVPNPPHLTLHWPRAAPVWALADCTAPDGRSVIASGDARGRVRLSSPHDGSTTELTGSSSSGEILGLAGLGHAGPFLLASVGSRRPAELWSTDDRSTTLPEWESGNCAVAVCSGPHGRPALAIGTLRGHLRLSSLSEPDEPDRGLLGHAGRITGLAATGAGSGLVSVSADRSVRTWETTGRAAIATATATAEWTAPLRSVAVDARRGLVVTGDETGRVACWTQDDLTFVRAFRAHSGAVTALATLVAADGVSWLASGGEDGAVRVWDPATGRPASRDLTGHTAAVTCLAALLDEPEVVRLASGSRDGTVRVWTPELADGDHRAPEPAVPARRVGPPRSWRLDVGSGAPVTLVVAEAGRLSCRIGDRPQTSLPVDGLRSATAYVNDGRTVVVTADKDGVLRAWDALTGSPVCRPLLAHDQWVHALAVLEVPDADPVLVSGDDDGRMCFWAPSSATLLHEVRLGTPILGVRPVPDETGVLAVTLDEGELVLDVAERTLSSADGGRR